MIECSTDGCVRKATRYPLKGVCDACYNRARRHANPDRTRAEVKSQSLRKMQRRRTDEVYAESTRAAARKHRLTLSVEERRRRDRAKQLNGFGLTPEQYDVQESIQNNMCALCDTEPVSVRLNIDHDHACCSEPSKSCGKCLRGLLCGSCNRGLGLFKDDVKVLSRAITYIQDGGVWT